MNNHVVLHDNNTRISVKYTSHGKEYLKDSCSRYCSNREARDVKRTEHQQRDSAGIFEFVDENQRRGSNV